MSKVKKVTVQVANAGQPSNKNGHVSPGESVPSGGRIICAENDDRPVMVRRDEEITNVILTEYLRVHDINEQHISRDDKTVNETHKEYLDKTNWHYFAEMLYHDLIGEKRLSARVRKKAQEGCRRIEKKYGGEELQFDPFTSGLVEGRFSALAWVLGKDW